MTFLQKMQPALLMILQPASPSTDHMQQINTNYLNHTRGFSLIEMAVVLLIVALLLGGLIPTVTSQIEQKNRTDTRKQLDDIQQALIGFAVMNARLPCPASPTSNGQESFCTTTTPGNCGAEIIPPAILPTHGRCARPYDGFVPAATLGITPVDSSGYALDGWNNRIRYAVSTISSSNVFTFTATPSVMSTVGISNLNGDLFVCASSPNPATPSQSMTGSPWCGTATSLTSTAPAVIYSTGNNGVYGGNSADELANANPYTNPTASPNSYLDKVFVSHAQTTTFDDIVIWISPNILINKMLAAGKLP